VVLVDPAGRVCARHAWRRERMAAQFTPSRLDRALAAGAPPEASAVLALRARRLASPHLRLVYARSLQRLLRSADAPSSMLSAHTSAVRLDRVRAAHDELELLVARLTARAPVSSRGVALVSVMLGDGAGPLYSPGSHADLAVVVLGAVRALEPERDWA
jgi:hypothetical protein